MFLPGAHFQQQMEASETDHCLIWLPKSNCQKKFQPLKVICIPLWSLNIIISSPADTEQLGIYLNGRCATVVLWLSCCSPDVTLHTQHSSITSDRGKTVLEAGLIKKNTMHFWETGISLPHSVHSVVSIDLKKPYSGAWLLWNFTPCTKGFAITTAGSIIFCTTIEND